MTIILAYNDHNLDQNMTEFSIIGEKVSKILPKFSKILDQTWGHFRDEANQCEN